MKFTLLNREIDISEGRKNYMQIVHYFKCMAQKAVEDFNAEYNDRMGLVFLTSSYSEKFLNTYGSDGYMDRIVMRYVAQTRKYLTQYGVYDLSDTEIWNNAVVTDDRSVSRLQYELNEFIDECVDRYEDDAEIVPRIKAKFEGTFFDACLRSDVLALCDFTLNYLDDHNLAKIQFVYKDDADRARAIYQNLKDSALTQEQIVEIMCSIPSNLSPEAFAAEYERRVPAKIPQEEYVTLATSMIDLDPRDISYFECVFENLPAGRQEIAAIAKYLGYDLSHLIEEDIKERFDLEKIKCEEDALKMKEDLLNYIQGYGLSKAPVLSKLEDVLRRYDVEARTYDGVCYKTREQRAKAEADDKEIGALYADSGNANKASYVCLIKDLSNKAYDEGIKNKHIMILQNAIADMEKEEMESILKNLDESTQDECAEIKTQITNYDALYAPKDPYFKRIEDRIVAIWKAELEKIIQGVDAMPEEACEEAKQKIQAHCAPDELKNTFKDRVDKRIYAIWDAEDFARFSEIFKQTPVGDSEAVGKNCVLIQKEGRTDTKELFVKALYLLNESEIVAVAKYSIAKDSGTLASLLNMGKKESYQILTLNGRVIHPAIEEEIRKQKEAKSGGLLGGLGKLTKPFGFGKTNQTTGSFCPNCGKPIDPEAKFCPSCGNKVN